MSDTHSPPNAGSEPATLQARVRAELLAAIERTCDNVMDSNVCTTCGESMWMHIARAEILEVRGNIEQMREWLEATANACVARNGVGMLSEQACRTVDEFSRLFPKSRDAWDDLRDAGGMFPKVEE